MNIKTSHNLGTTDYKVYEQDTGDFRFWKVVYELDFHVTDDIFFLMMK